MPYNKILGMFLYGGCGNTAVGPDAKEGARAGSDGRALRGGCLYCQHRRRLEGARYP